MKVIAETPRLLMREFDSTDAKNIFALDSNVLVHKYLGLKPLEKIEQAQAIVKGILEQYTANGFGRLAVINKASLEFMGWSGLKLEKQVQPFAYIDLGYRFLPQFWQQGFGYESAVASIHYGFEELDKDIIHAGAHVDNIGSNRILQKLGMTMLNTFTYDGEPHNWFELKRTNWNKTDPSN